MNTTTISKEESISSFFDESMSKWTETIALFDDDHFNKIPFEGSWTARQVAEHLYKSISRLPQLLMSETKEADRNPFEKCEAIASIFLNFDVKLKSPDFILPSDEPKQVAFFVEAFKKTAGEMHRVSEEVDLTRLYTRFPFPQMDVLTGWEWIYFAAAHTTRHTRQLKNIFEKLKA
jgi:hypothetical protein